MMINKHDIENWKNSVKNWWFKVNYDDTVLVHLLITVIYVIVLVGCVMWVK